MWPTRAQFAALFARYDAAMSVMLGFARNEGGL
jgi:hypothetical protein